MTRAWMLAALLSLPAAAVADQATAVLHVTVKLQDAAGTSIPVARHVLLISDNPATAEPRRVVTRSDGTVEITLRAGNYTVESDRPVTLLGKAYQWTEFVDIPASGDVNLDLTAGNAEVVSITEAASATGDAPPDSDPSFLFGKWQGSIVAVWSPTARATGFVVDGRGLIVTNREAVGDGTAVDVELPGDFTVAARVVFSDAANPAAIVQVAPAAIERRAPIPVECPPARSASLDEGDEILTMVAPLKRAGDVTWGEVTSLAPRTVGTDLRLAFGGAGGPVFNAAGVVVGVTSATFDARTGQSDAVIVRAAFLCEALSVARAKAADLGLPPATRRPAEPTRPFPAKALEDARKGGADGAMPITLSSSDFDVAFITPPMVARAEALGNRGTGSAARSREAEALLGGLTDFGAWAEYFADAPPVLVVRVTPRLVEGFWKRLAREAARTQGAMLPAFKDFKSNFARMRASCGETEVVPIHPMVLVHPLQDRNMVREGLYVFAPDAFGPGCGSVTLTLESEQSSGDGETITIDPAVVDRLWQDFAPYRAAGAQARAPF